MKQLTTVKEKLDNGVYYNVMNGETQFKIDLLAENGVTENPKANLCYSKAWEFGHSAGLHEVQIYFEELVDLIKD